MENGSVGLGPVKFTYLEDPKVPDRVVTLARAVTTHGKLRVAWCVNRVVTEEIEEPNRFSSSGGKIHTYVVRVDDVFDKHWARVITHGRLKCDRPNRWVEVDAQDVKNVTAMMEGILNAKPDQVPLRVQRVVGHHVKAWKTLQKAEQPAHIITSFQ